MPSLKIGAIDKSDLKGLSTEESEEGGWWEETFEKKAVIAGDDFHWKFPEELVRLMKNIGVERLPEVEEAAAKLTEHSKFPEDLRHLESRLGDVCFVFDEKLSRALADAIIKFCDSGFEKWAMAYLDNKYDVKFETLFELKETGKYVREVNFDPQRKKIVAVIMYEEDEREPAANQRLKFADLYDCKSYEEFYKAPIFAIAGGKTVFHIELSRKSGRPVSKKDCNDLKKWIDEDDPEMLQLLCSLSQFLKEAKEPIIWGKIG